MDEADYASNEEESFRQHAMRKVTRKLSYRGHCYNCSDECPRLFCDVDCRTDYEKEQAIRQQQQAHSRGKGGSDERPSS
jgi:hypothetical protein